MHSNKKGTLSIALAFVVLGAIALALGEIIGGCIKTTCRGLFCYVPGEGAAPVTVAPDTPSICAVLVTTNIVAQPCNCGFCDNARGIRVPEHVGVIGCDLRIEVSTNYLPIVQILGEGK